MNIFIFYIRSDDKIVNVKITDILNFTLVKNYQRIECLALMIGILR